MPTELHSSQRQLYQPEIQKIEIFLDLLIFGTVSQILSSEFRNFENRTPKLRTSNSELQTPNLEMMYPKIVKTKSVLFTIWFWKSKVLEIRNWLSLLRKQLNTVLQ